MLHCTHLAPSSLQCLVPASCCGCRYQLNTEKLEYNYRVLVERDHENQVGGTAYTVTSYWRSITLAICAEHCCLGNSFNLSVWYADNAMTPIFLACLRSASQG